MANERPEKKDRRDLLILLLIVLLSFLCMIFMGGLATQLAPSWMLDTNMNSGINPDDYYTPEINSIAPINEEILTQRVSENYLTPGAQQPTLISSNATPTPVSPRTQVPPSPTAVRTGVATVTNVFTPRPTSTLQIPSSPTPVQAATKTPRPPTKTPKPTVPSADLSITKTDGKTTYTPGMDVTYTIVVSNAGPDDVTGAAVSDAFPQKLAAIHWTCAGTGGGSCTASGNHVINDTIDLPAGATVTYTVTAKAKSSATGNLRNTASVTPPAGITDPDGSNNSATDRDTPVYISDLSITKTDGVNNYTPGGKVTYTIVVSNAGPSDASGFRIVDNVPASITGLTVNCVPGGGASCGTNNTSGHNVRFDNASVSAGGGNQLTITISGTVAPGTTGDLVNTARIVIPAGAGFSDPDTSNNSSTDTDTLATSADLGITKAADITSYVPGDPMTYTIQVSNAGPHDVSGATVADTFPAEVTVNSWSCTPSPGASCTASGSGDINDTVDLPVNATVTYTVDVTVDLAATGDIVNTATVDPPAVVNDPIPGNNSATVTTPPEVCVIGGGQMSVPDTGCILNRPALGTNGNLYTLTNNDVGSLTIIWYGPAENQTTGACGLFQVSALNPGDMKLYAVADIGFGNTILIIQNPTTSTIVIDIVEAAWSTGAGCP